MKPIIAIILSAICGAALAEGKPNVIVILTDDQGYGDIAAHGNPVLKTPNLDRLRAESARLTDFHVDPTCSPTRSALLTGKYPHRVKVWHTIAGGNHLRADELTMADIFRANGYRTGMFGKWHLGSNLPYRPIDRAEFIVGDDRDPETFLHSSDWYLPVPPWNHGAVAAGSNAAGDWRIRAARAGTYRFEVRRWPREADAPLAGTPTITKTVDAWDAAGPKPDLLYGGTKTRFKALPVAEVRLKVGDKTQTLPVNGETKHVDFKFDLETGRSLDVKAGLLDRSGKLLAGGYYVYCSFLSP